MDIVEKLKLYSDLGPENYIAGSLAVTAMMEAAAELERLRGALADIINPIGAMQRDLEDGYRLDGAMAVAMANDPEHYKRIARAALTANVLADRREPIGEASNERSECGRAEG